MVDKPQIFSIKPRKDLIQKAIEISQSRNKQIQGRNKEAGLKNTAESWGTGHGLSRAPRIKGSGFITARHVGRVPFAVGGRRTHPIKTDKNLKKKINKKTHKLSIMSAISASGYKPWQLLAPRGMKTFYMPNIAFNMVCGGEHVPGTKQDIQEMFFLAMNEKSIKDVFSKAIKFFKQLLLMRILSTKYAKK